MEKLMEVRYQDEAQKISLTGYADTLIVDSKQDKLVGIRVGGYPEVVSGLSAAICGGGTVTVSTADGSLLCTAERGRYCKTVSREDAYAVAILLWNSQEKRTPSKPDHTAGTHCAKWVYLTSGGRLPSFAVLRRQRL